MFMGSRLFRTGERKPRNSTELGRGSSESLSVDSSGGAKRRTRSTLRISCGAGWYDFGSSFCFFSVAAGACCSALLPSGAAASWAIILSAAACWAALGAAVTSGSLAAASGSLAVASGSLAVASGCGAGGSVFRGPLLFRLESSWGTRCGAVSACSSGFSLSSVFC